MNVLRLRLEDLVRLDLAHALVNHRRAQHVLLAEGADIDAAIVFANLHRSELGAADVLWARASLLRLCILLLLRRDLATLSCHGVGEGSRILKYCCLRDR